MVKRKRGAKVNNIRKSSKKVHKKPIMEKVNKESSNYKTKTEEVIDEYTFDSNDMPIVIKIINKPNEFIPIYDVSISSISKATEMMLEQIRKKLVKEVGLGMIEITDIKNTNLVDERFKDAITILIKKYFPDVDDHTRNYLTTYLVQKSLGLGSLDILMHDVKLEEVVVNTSKQQIWVYHKKHGWLKTNIKIETEGQTKNYASMIGRKVGRQLTVLEPLLDAHLGVGDRVNATLMPISTEGNTITIRMFSRDPFTITKFLKFNTISRDAAALIWLGMQYELSALITGGTASGKTSALNVLASFIPPNQRVISIEDTRELRLPKFLHWVPMQTRQPNPEGKGEVSMEDLLVNSLRMRPDRILVGEIRRQKQAETLFEAIHTGHSCYATFHANNVDETINRLTHPPINVPSTLLPAISMIIVQFRNRRTGVRRTFQIAEILPDAKSNLLLQYDAKTDILKKSNKSKSLIDTLQLYTGNSKKEIDRLLKDKSDVLSYLVKNDLSGVDQVGRVMAEYYTNKNSLMKLIKANKVPGDFKRLEEMKEETPGIEKLQQSLQEKFESKKTETSEIKTTNKNLPHINEAFLKEENKKNKPSLRKRLASKLLRRRKK
jgi:archaeal flagellar protein FlaI